MAMNKKDYVYYQVYLALKNSRLCRDNRNELIKYVWNFDSNISAHSILRTAQKIQNTQGLFMSSEQVQKIRHNAFLDYSAYYGRIENNV